MANLGTPEEVRFDNEFSDTDNESGEEGDDLLVSENLSFDGYLVEGDSDPLTDLFNSNQNVEISVEILDDITFEDENEDKVRNNEPEHLVLEAGSVRENKENRAGPPKAKGYNRILNRPVSEDFADVLIDRTAFTDQEHDISMADVPEDVKTSTGQRTTVVDDKTAHLHADTDSEITEPTPTNQKPALSTVGNTQLFEDKSSRPFRCLVILGLSQLTENDSYQSFPEGSGLSFQSQVVDESESADSMSSTDDLTLDSSGPVCQQDENDKTADWLKQPWHLSQTDFTLMNDVSCSLPATSAGSGRSPKTRKSLPRARIYYTRLNTGLSKHYIYFQSS